MTMKVPIQFNAAPLACAGTLAVVPAQASVGGDGGSPGTGAVPVARLTTARIYADYTRAGGSTTGRPILVVEVSRDPVATTAPGAVVHWTPLPALDPTSFTAGAVESYPQEVRCNPSAAGESTYAWPAPIDLTGVEWIRVRAADVDNTTPGTLTISLLGE